MLQFLALGVALAGSACEPPAAASLPAAGTAEAAPAATRSEELVRGRLVADATGFVAGEERWIGVTFEIEDGWHIYALARNDSGSPVTVKLDLPAGYSDLASPLQPMAKRHIAPGALLDHVYEGQVTLPLRVTVPRDAAPGSTATFRAHAEWFVCKDVCVPGTTDVELTVPIVAAHAERRPSSDEARLRDAESRLPRPLPERDAPVSLVQRGDTLEVRAEGATGLTFVPYPQCVAMPQLIEDGERTGATLSLRLDPQRGADAVVAGALEVRREDGPTAFHSFTQAVPPDRGSSSH